VEKAEIIITGRTKHFLSLCGEHLSVDNMNKAIEMLSDQLGLNIKEFTVAGIPHQGLFAHKWYIGCDDVADPVAVKVALDENLKIINDDYRVERSSALKDIKVEIVPARIFYEWMKANKKEGAQNKFPRVMKNKQFTEWEDFVQQNHYSGAEHL
jgi:hypothetical protein